jgi:hypothetical protein
MQLSEHFTLAEATFSSMAERLGIDNSGDNVATLASAMYTASKMERVRALLDNKSIHVNSWIRSVPLNRALGSKDTSQHIVGEAVDFICAEFGTPLAIAQKLIDYMELLDFDQLILEHSWIHISFKQKANRREILSLLATGSYARGLTDKNGNPY